MQRLRSVRPVSRFHGVAQRVSECLAYEDMMAIPAEYEAFSVTDHRRRIRLHPELSWEDTCPAYALALATHDAYHGRLGLGADDELEAQWDELRGGSAMDWPVARVIIREAWRWLGAQPAERSALRH